MSIGRIEMSAAGFFSSFGFVAIIFLLLLGLLFLVNQFQKKSMALLSRLSATYNEVETLLVRMTNSLDATNRKIADLEARLSQMDTVLATQARQISEIADGFTEHGQMTKAIDLARSGSSVQEIMLATKLPEEEAEAIVKFHAGKAV